MEEQQKQKKPFYKKWWVWIIAIIVVVSLASGGEEETTTQPKEQTSIEIAKEVSMDAKEIERFNSYVVNIKGASFLKEAKIEENKAFITYVEDFNDYKKVNPESKLKEKDYKDYWGTGDAINKALMGESVRLLREFPDLNKVSMVLPFDGKTYSVELDRKMVESYFKINLQELHEDKTNELWRNKFSNPYLGNKEERAKFVEKFVQIKTDNPKDNKEESKKEDTKAEDNVPIEYKSALKKAETYAKTMHMSKNAIFEQLTSEYGEKFSVESAKYAMNNLEFDWKVNALKKAETYSKTMHMSKQGIYDQLVSEQGEKFTDDEAQYAIDNIQANFNENALEKAKTYQDTMSMSPEAIRDQLTSEHGEKFTQEEADYAIKNLGK